MTKPTRLPDDVARCYGVPGIQVCHDCLRRLQMQHDKPYGIYAYLQGDPVNEHCDQKVSTRD